MKKPETTNILCRRIQKDILVCLVLLLMTLAVYWQVQNHDFTSFDDNYYVTENDHVRSGLSAENFRWAFSFEGKEKTYWHPLAWLSHMVDVELFGMNPGMHLAVNTLLHSGNTVLLFFFLRLATGAFWRSAVVAILFALHPLNVESVAWVAARKNVLSTFFWILVLIAYLQYVRNSDFRHYAILLLVFLCSLMVKPMLVTLPFVLLLLDYWPLRRMTERGSDGADGNVFRKQIKADRTGKTIHCVLEKVPLLMLSGLLIFVAVFSFKDGTISVAKVPLPIRFENAVVSYIRYIGKIFWPQDLAVFYPFPESIPTWQTLGAGCLLAILTWVFSRSVRSAPYLIVGWLWFLGTLVPVIGLVQAGLWPAMADRFTYIPQIGIYIIVAWGIHDLARNRIKPVYIAASVAVAASLLFVMTLKQVTYWQNSKTLFERAASVTAHNAVAHYNLGCVLDREKRQQAAMAQYEKALSINPYYARAHNNLGNSLLDLGLTQRALVHLQNAVRLDPLNAEAHNNIGVALTKIGDTKGAERQFKESLKINPEYAEAHNNLGAVLRWQGKNNEAVRHYMLALQYMPDYIEARNNLGKALLGAGKKEMAKNQFKRVLALSPEDNVARRELEKLSQEAACSVQMK
jgi:tetratricopeptide (TPR) repeat protein